MKTYTFLLKTVKFREDLYYRLKTEIIFIPPLRKRQDDIPLLAKGILRKSGAPPIMNKYFSDEALSLLKRQPWTGNIRQLKNLVVNTAYRQKGDEITYNAVKNELLKEYSLFDEKTHECELFEGYDNLEDKLEAIRKMKIMQCIEEHKGKVTAAAAALGYSNHNSLQRWMKIYGINPDKYRD